MTSPVGGQAPEQVELIESIGGEATATLPAAPAPSRRLAPDGRIRSGRLAGLSMWMAIWVLSWPILIESLLNSMVGLVDTMLAAGLSESATDAIGGAAYFAWFLTLVASSIGVGATAMVSRAMGKGRQAVGNAVVGQSILLAAVAGVVVAGLMILAAPEMARMLRLSGDAAAQFVEYIRIVSAGVPMMSVMMVGLACCRGAGDTLRPLITMIVVNVVNIGVSWMLAGVDIAVGGVGEGGETVRRVLVENPFGFNLGIAGIAWGTVAAWTAGSGFIVYWLVRGSPGVRLRAKRLRPHWHTMRRLIRVGLPNMLEMFGMWFGNFLVILFVGWMARPGYLGAHIVAIRVEAFSFLPGFAMGVAAATLTGQYVGAGSPQMARLAMLRCMGIASVMMGLCGVVFIVFPRELTGVFSQQPTHLELVPKLITIAGFVQIPFAIMLVLREALRGAGDTRMAMILTWVATYAIRLPLAFFLCGVDIPLPDWLGGGVIPNPSPWKFGLVGLWYGLCGELVLRTLLYGARFLHGGWERIKV